MEECHMVKVIMGKRGSGKTKQVIDMVNYAVNVESGHVVCVEKGQKLRFDINHQARLVDISSYPVTSYDAFIGFLCGMMAANYDITHVFIDSLYKIVNDDSPNDAVGFIARLDQLSEEHHVSFTITISADVESATEELKKYF